LLLVLGKTGVKLTDNVFDEMGVYWAEIAYKNQTDKQVQFLTKQLNPDGIILDLACGTGRHTVPLSQQGFNLVGLDVSAKLLEIARQRGHGVQLVRGDMRFLPFKTEAFTGAVSMDTSFGYLASESDDAQSLSELRRVLRQESTVVVDVFNRQNLAAKYKGKNPAPKTREYPSFTLLQTRTVNSSGDWLCDFWMVLDKSVGQVKVFEHTVRLYEPAQLQGLLEKSGFEVDEVCGGYEGEQFSPASSRLIFVARAKFSAQLL
jgi:ubiquinone/menaquinone biosynthesis C-methylase UbiE